LLRLNYLNPVLGEVAVFNRVAYQMQDRIPSFPDHRKPH